MTLSQIKPISKVIESVKDMHGDERRQAAKHAEYLEFLRLHPNFKPKFIPSAPHRESINDGVKQ